MALAISYPKLSVSEGFGVNSNGVEPYGQLISLKVGSTTIPADIGVSHPVGHQKYNIVGALASYSWTSVAKDPMKLTFNVSGANGERLKTLLKNPLTNMNLEINFQIFSYDPGSKSFYVAAKSFNDPHHGIMNKFSYKLVTTKTISYPVRGILPKAQGKPMLIVGPSSYVTSPINYSVELVIYPATDAQDIVYATSPKINNKSPWGGK
jgi:hypothetical protein